MGRLEIFHEGEWGSICELNRQSWNDKASTVACRELGFPGFIRRTNTIRGFGIVWTDSVKCNGTEQSILDCSHFSWLSSTCSHWYDITLQCQTGI